MLKEITKYCIVEKDDNGAEEIINAYSKKEKAEEVLKEVLEIRQKDLESKDPCSWYYGTDDWKYYIAEIGVNVFVKD